MKKRIVSLVLAMAMCLSLSITAFAEAPIDQAREWAEEVGLPKAFLESAKDQLILQIYEENYLSEEVFFEADVGYYTKDGSSLQRGSISSADLEFWIVVAKNVSGGYIRSLNCYVYFTWDPGAQILYYTDAIMFNWADDMWSYSDATANFSLETYGGLNDKPYTGLQEDPDLRADRGLGWYIDLLVINGPPYGWGTFTLYAKHETLNSNAEYADLADFHATYAHSTSSLNGVTLGLSKDGLDSGVEISGSYDSTTSSTNVKYAASN